MASSDGYECDHTEGARINCAACSQPNGQECISCRPGYTYPVGSCSRRMCNTEDQMLQERCLDCNEPYGNKCNFCIEGYEAKDNCQSKAYCFDYLENCDRCLQDYPECCVECKPGYRGFLCDSIQCNPDDSSLENCASCTTPNGFTCDSCFGGFMDPTLKCTLMECDRIFDELENCYSCEGELATTCSKCVEGFNLQGNKCVKAKTNAGMIVGIVVAVLVVVAVVATLVWWFFCRRDSGVRSYRNKETFMEGESRVAAEQ